MMKNDLDRAMKDWRCTSKEELTVETEARSWDETIDNVWFRMVMCDHLLEFKTWRQDDPKLCRAYLMIRPQDTSVYSGNAWRSSWEGQHRMQGLLGQTFSDINGNCNGRANRFGNNTGNVYGTRVTRR